MDFSIVGLDNFMRSSNSASENTAEHNNYKWYGSGHLKQKKTTNEDEMREYYNKMTKTCSTNSSLSEDHQQMLSFSSSNSQALALPYYHNASSKNTGMKSTEMHGLVSGISGPFTTSQWMELEHQALIYKYIIANVPIPSYLLNPIRKALESAGFSGFTGLRNNDLGWGGFHLGFANTDPEPGRCRRTDGKKWRCSRDAVAEQKYCERHINRGRHRSRKPVEGHTASVISTTNANNLTLTSKDNAYGRYQNPTVLSTTSSKVSLKDNPNAYNESCRPEFGSVCYDSLLNPLNSSSSLVNSRLVNLSEHSNKSHHALRQFMGDWPKNRSQHSVTSDLTSMTASPSNLSLELEATQMGLGMGSSIIEQSQKQTSWAWETSRGGPLGEVLHTRGECKQAKALDLIENPNSTYGSLSNSSPASSLSYGYIGSALMHSSLPAL